ncbi:NUDIX hydrolase [Streptomyces sp. NPDC090442]|uniref:NUDIX hydrolase n=1 Tax=Streptomyces sp. NPDC090442 TaxID=3365962 RepID=UPI003812AB2A
MRDQGTNDRRQSARVVLIDARDRVLLLKFRVTPGRPEDGHGWTTPGGGVEADESLAEAAARELCEEIGLAVAPEALGPQVAEASGYAELGGAAGNFRDVFFHCRVTDHRVRIDGQEEHERASHAGHGWWTVDELRDSGETIYPLGLGDLAAELVAGRIPATPRQLPWHH